MKNTDGYLITVRNEQTDGDMHDVVCESGKGTFREKGGVLYIAYKTEGATVFVKAKEGLVKVRRSGDADSEIIYSQGKRTFFEYKTPYGSVRMSVFTISISVSHESIRLNYVLGIDEDGVMNNMLITIKGDK